MRQGCQSEAGARPAGWAQAPLAYGDRCTVTVQVLPALRENSPVQGSTVKCAGLTGVVVRLKTHRKKPFPVSVTYYTLQLIKERGKM